MTPVLRAAAALACALAIAACGYYAKPIRPKPATEAPAPAPASEPGADDEDRRDAR